ncbi:MAG TPA: hypothetical protein VM553_06000 [Dongiaceae bacterium]|nr:hypothetical protein [Dongiaceae bacterium]
MEEARKLRTILYPLARDIRNLSTFVANINNVLQADAQRFVVGAPVGLLSIRNSVRSLNKNVRAMKDVNDIALQESSVAAALSETTGIPLLRPALQLNLLSRNAKQAIDRTHTGVVRVEGYLNPVFVFMAALIPVVESMQAEVQALDEKMSLFKKAVSRLSDQELTSGLPLAVEKQLETLIPQFSVIEQETADVAAQVGLLMGKMNRLSELSSKLEVLLRMSSALDGSLQDLVPAMAVLKTLGSVLNQAQKPQDLQAAPLERRVADAVAGLKLPVDTLAQLEMRLAHQMDRYILPIMQPLQDLAEQLRPRIPSTHELNGLESTLVAQSIRFGNVGKLLTRLFGNLDRLIAQVKQATHAA